MLKLEQYVTLKQEFELSKKEVISTKIQKNALQQMLNS